MWWLRASVLISVLLMVSAAHAQERIALVIGNSAYQHAPKLANPANDAADFSAALRKRGFQVIEGFDLDKVALERSISAFVAALKRADVGLFYYAGHGLQVAGQNYLVPVDAQLSTADALDFEMVRVESVQRVMERSARTSLLFLDACRDNPLARNLARAMGTRSSAIGRGLAAVQSGVGTLISFSTQPGNVALDGTGRNSPFAAALVKQVSDSSDDLHAVLIAVRNEVMQQTLNKQVPWEHSALTGRFFFGPAAPPPSAAPELRSGPQPAAYAVVQAGGLFTEQHMQRVQAFAEKHGLPLPDFHFEVPAADVPPALRRFVGVWAHVAGINGNTARSQMIFVTRVDKDGNADGHYVFGAPTRKAFTQGPASASTIAAKISANSLRFSRGSVNLKFTPKGGNRMSYFYTDSNARTAWATFDPVWSLSEAERSTKR
jgi:hypothetical protein